MADALERATNLLALLLEARRPLTLDEIAGELAGQYPDTPGSRRGAFERDKQTLREIGVPIDTEVLTGAAAGQTGYSINRQRYELADLHLEPDERGALQVAVAATRSVDAAFGLLKLGEAAAGSVTVQAPLPELEVLPALREAAARRAEVAFAYRGTARRLQPYTLLLRRGFWYVIGFDTSYGEIRTYRADRVEGQVVAGPPDAFARPPGFDPLAVFPADPKELGGADAHAVVRIDPSRARLVEGELGTPAVVHRGQDGTVEVEVACANLAAFRSWLFGWGDHAEVVSPAEVRAAVIDWLRATARR
jgi:proteasome accessory factor B